MSVTSRNQSTHRCIPRSALRYSSRQALANRVAGRRCLMGKQRQECLTGMWAHCRRRQMNCRYPRMPWRTSLKFSSEAGRTAPIRPLRLRANGRVLARSKPPFPVPPHEHIHRHLRAGWHRVGVVIRVATSMAWIRCSSERCRRGRKFRAHPVAGPIHRARIADALEPENGDPVRRVHVDNHCVAVLGRPPGGHQHPAITAHHQRSQTQLAKRDGRCLCRLSGATG